MEAVVVLNQKTEQKMKENQGLFSQGGTNVSVSKLTAQTCPTCSKEGLREQIHCFEVMYSPLLGQQSGKGSELCPLPLSRGLPLLQWGTTCCSVEADAIAGEEPAWCSSSEHLRAWSLSHWRTSLEQDYLVDRISGELTRTKASASGPFSN